MEGNFLLEFGDEDTPAGVTRTTLKSLAKVLGMTENMTVQLALSRLASEKLPAYEKDDGPLSRNYNDWLVETISAKLPMGKRITRRSLL
jgi:hypothetical protein